MFTFLCERRRVPIAILRLCVVNQTVHLNGILNERPLHLLPNVEARRNETDVQQVTLRLPQQVSLTLLCVAVASAMASVLPHPPPPYGAPPHPTYIQVQFTAIYLSSADIVNNGEHEVPVVRCLDSR